MFLILQDNTYINITIYTLLVQVLMRSTLQNIFHLLPTDQQPTGLYPAKKL
jgi:hypothetical protein